MPRRRGRMRGRKVPAPKSRRHTRDTRRRIGGTKVTARESRGHAPKRRRRIGGTKVTAPESRGRAPRRRRRTPGTKGSSPGSRRRTRKTKGRAARHEGRTCGWRGRTLGTEVLYIFQEFHARIKSADAWNKCGGPEIGGQDLRRRAHDITSTARRGSRGEAWGSRCETTVWDTRGLRRPRSIPPPSLCRGA
jgi:hypothetical protein